MLSPLPVRLSAVFAFFLLLSSGLTAQQGPFERTQPEAVGLSPDSLARMDAHFHRLVDEGQLAGIQTAILRKGQLAHYDSYGFANLKEEAPLTKQSIFRIFSMTKPIVSVAIMQLVEAGEIDLEDPVGNYLPQFKSMKVYTESGAVPAKSPIRFIDLLRHTSGLSYGRSAYPDVDQQYADADLVACPTNHEFVGKLSQLPLLFEPGTNWKYSYSTDVLGYFLEVFQPQPLDVYLQENVLGPLGMNDTHFQLPEEKVEHFTVGYRWQNETGLTVAEPQRENRYVEEVTRFRGGGGLVSTALDYLKFCQMLLNEGTFNGHQVLKPESVRLMLQDHLQEARQQQEQLSLPPHEYGFGLGFAVRDNPETVNENVFGWGGAVGTYFKVDPEHDLAYVLMIQLSPYRHLGLRELFHGYVQGAVVE